MTSLPDLLRSVADRLPEDTYVYEDTPSPGPWYLGMSRQTFERFAQFAGRCAGIGSVGAAFRRMFDLRIEVRGDGRADQVVFEVGALTEDGVELLRDFADHVEQA